MALNPYQPSAISSDQVFPLWRRRLRDRIGLRVTLSYMAGAVTGFVSAMCYGVGNAHPFWSLFSPIGLLAIAFLSLLSLIPSVLYVPPRSCRAAIMVRILGGLTFGMVTVQAEQIIRRVIGTYSRVVFIDYDDLGNLALSLLAGTLVSAGVQMMFAQRLQLVPTDEFAQDTDSQSSR